MTFLLETLRLGFTSLMLHKLRSLLTALGIIIGVAAVVAIAAYTEGSKQRILADIRQLGARNIIIRSVKPPEPSTTESSSGSGGGRGGRTPALAYGLRQIDLRRIRETVAPLERLVALKQVGGRVTRGRYQAQAQVFGASPELLDVTSLQVERGRYWTQGDLDKVDNVAVIGAEVARRLFPLGDPLDGELRIDAQTFKIIGVLREVGLAGGAGSALVGRDLNFDIHIPMTTARSRFGDMIMRRSSGSFEATRIEISEIYVQVAREDQVRPIAETIKAVVDREHAAAQDVSVRVPLELLEQAERSQMLFTILMIVIAGLSLLVGGIGIMNIMLASVTERTREIGIRRALGATRRHIIAQFLVETTALSGIGGVIGILVGAGAALLMALAHHFWPVIEQPEVRGWSIAVSFGVATMVGIVFGLYPAIQAARQDPIEALRHD